MSSAAMVHAYGYAAIALGALLEGEVAVLVGGALAAAGLLSFSGALASGLGGVLASDTAYFFLGRYAGHRLGRWFPNLFGELRRAFDLMDEYSDLLLVFFPFCPGLSPTAPVAFGMTRTPVSRFLALDFVGNGMWAILFLSTGWLAGHWALPFLQLVNPWVWLALAGAFPVAVTIRFARKLRQPKHNNLRWGAPSSGALHSG